MERYHTSAGIVYSTSTEASYCCVGVLSLSLSLSLLAPQLKQFGCKTEPTLLPFFASFIRADRTYSCAFLFLSSLSIDLPPYFLPLSSLPLLSLLFLSFRCSLISTLPEDCLRLGSREVVSGVCVCKRSTGCERGKRAKRAKVKNSIRTVYSRNWGLKSHKPNRVEKV